LPEVSRFIAGILPLIRRKRLLHLAESAKTWREFEIRDRKPYDDFFRGDADYP